ncbi:MAG: hypothetical protein ACLSE4_02170 [Clostridium sp.]
MTVSHANDSYFWVVSQFSDMDTQDAYKCRTGHDGSYGCYHHYSRIYSCL